VTLLSIIGINCPRCGAPATQRGEQPNEYICTHCNTIFVFYDATKQMVTTDSVVHNCPYCGKQVKVGEGYKCADCNENFFCANCVSESNGKYYCLSCFAKDHKKCDLCNDDGYYKCVKCGKQSCKKHVKDLGFAYRDNLIDICYHYCPTCKGSVCLACVKTSLLGDLKCPHCETILNDYRIAR
jgi:DNA-directed RNA polymerase subunit RPC12/RpoP